MTDYISREAVLERIDDIWDCADMVFEPNDHCCRADDCASCKWAETKNAIRKIIANFPAADVRPVVRGRWEDVHVRDYSTNINGGMPLSIASMFCPVCGRWHNEVYHYGNPTEMAHYCSNCGAMMEGS